MDDIKLHIEKLIGDIVPEKDLEEIIMRLIDAGVVFTTEKETAV